MTSLLVSDNPPPRPLGVKSIEELTGRWWVAHTKPRFEKRLAWDLLAEDVGYFLPLVERVRINSGRKRRVLMPLFTSYLFFCGNDDDRLKVFSTNRVCQVLEVSDQGTLAAELAAIDKALLCGAELENCPMAQVGRRARVTAGPFQGFEGTVVSVRDRTRLVLEVKALGQAASLQIETDLLEPLDDSDK